MASIKKINERKFKITISNGYRPDGRKICRAKTITVPDEVKPRGIRQYVDHAAEEFERFVKNGFGEGANTSFEKYAESWLDRQVKYAPSTLASYRRMLDVCYPYIGQLPLCKLRPVALENMLNELRERRFRGEKIQEATVQKYLTVVSAVLSDAKRNEIIQKNPARMIDLPMTEKRMQVIPSPQEAQEILSALYDEPFLFRVYTFLAIYTGYRRGELAALRWSDFTQSGDGAILTVSRSRSTVVGKGVVEGKTKNGRSRQIYIEKDVVDIIRSLYYEQEQSSRREGVPLSPYLFANRQDQPIHPDTFTKHLRRLYDDHGFPKEYHLHSLRHYFVSSLLHHGIDKQTVAELAGHGDTSFLERTYCHPQMALKQQAAQVMTADICGTLAKGESA